MTDPKKQSQQSVITAEATAATTKGAASLLHLSFLLAGIDRQIMSESFFFAKMSVVVACYLSLPYTLLLLLLLLPTHKTDSKSASSSETVLQITRCFVFISLAQPQKMWFIALRCFCFHNHNKLF